ncbi:MULTISPECIES: nuclease domain-containing protein [unclassified Vibrio]|uniref:nuclease domain-containing protein n=1 Tax=unclassified Vibrio TaxID=2614977 RepID=UPI000B8E59CF|nr:MULTISPECIES: nuclease domain-containing protein [unclassified Vibrio]NAX44819.1 DUF1364 family protein [Vibrio sp. V25_P4S6T154]OXX40926.1 hypothetical protein B9J93_21085 [Vibrio sp. V17_P4S1T151]OXX59180.1 hypothetical protein B9J89_19545 [Vibrio sp. V15_P4S5T153]OXX65420.1 hypothetical protein B9J94_15435 [Vibrio sp. V20_P4S3T152]
MTLARSKKILKSAKGEDCTLRLVGICNFNPETTVFAHIGKRRGMGIKCADYFGIYACSSCHDVIDSRVNSDYTKDQLAYEELRALEETQEKLIEKGMLVVE